jgi:hypothetical protein
MNESPRPKDTAHAASTEPDPAPGITLRSVLVLLILGALSLIWIRRASLIDFTCLVGEGTPALPAVVALVLLGALGPKVRRWCRQLALSRAESLAVYFALTIIAPISCANIVRQLLPTLTVLPYYASPENHFAQFADELPRWLAPRDPKLILDMFEGTPTGAVPWSGWAVPLLVWAGVIVVYTAAMLCWVTLFREQWTRNERLSFPLVGLAVHLIDAGEASSDTMSGGRRRTRMPPLLSSGLFWIGFSVSAVFNLFNIAHIFDPSVPATGLQFDFGQFLTEKPWSGLRPIPMHFRPEVVGLAYFAPQEACLSVWLFYLVLRFERFFAELAGWSLPGMPFEAAQSQGAYLALAVCLVYAARHHLAAVARSILGRGATGAEEREPLSYRLAFVGGCLGAVALWAFFVVVGIRPWVAGLYAALLFATPLVYSRMRAEMGIPMSYAWPIGQWVRGIYSTFGSQALAGGAGIRPLVALSTLSVLDRLAVQNFMADGLEAMKAEEVVGARRRDLAVWAILLGLVLGIAGGYLTHLTAYYRYGDNVIDGGTILGGYRTQQAVWTFRTLDAMVASPVQPDRMHAVFMGVGFAVVCALTVLRSLLLRFPLAPLGFAVAAAYGHVPWFAFLTAWTLKTIIHRLGGAALRVRVAPAFFGLVMGHYLVGGGLWGILGMFTPKAREYIVWFC